VQRARTLPFSDVRTARAKVRRLQKSSIPTPQTDKSATGAPAMSTFRNYLLRRLSGRPPVLHKPHQRRWARVHDARYLATHPVQERITDRYREKLERKAKE
jgi:hypothetical protein